MRYLIPCLALVLPVAICQTTLAHYRAVDDPFPATTTGRCAKDFIATLNNPKPDAVRAFETRWASRARLERSSIESRVDSLGEIHDHLGALTISRVTTDPLTAFASAANGEDLAFQFIMSTLESDKLDAVQIMPAAEAVASPLTSELIRSTVEGVATRLRESYVFPDIGDKMADSLLAKLKAGEYDAITGEQALAARLTDDCRAISKDKHLGVRTAPAKSSSTSPAPRRDDPRRDNFGFRKVELLPGNIGYLRFDMFFEGKEAYDVASSAMNFLAGADAIIFDLRFNGGGSPAMIRHITSYLFDSRTHLNDMVDRHGRVVEEYWTLDKVSGRKPRADIPIYVLTSGRTFSGAEEFTYNLQNLQRATIIGQTTGGGAHPVRREPVNDRFVLGVPYMRAQNPISHTNWEGAGVEPDIKCTADAALDKALELARAATKSKQ